MKKVTPEQVRRAVLEAHIDYIPHHNCGGCGTEVSFTVEEGQLYFNPGCDCSRRWSPREPREWEDASDWINMQESAVHRNAIRAKFGMPPEEPNP